MHGWMGGIIDGWVWMDVMGGSGWVWLEGYVPEPHVPHNAQPVLFWKCDPLQKSLSALCKPPLPAHCDGLATHVASQTPLRAEPCRHLRQSLEMVVAAVGSMHNFEPAMVAVRLKAQHTSGISTRNLSAKDTLLTRG